MLATISYCFDQSRISYIMIEIIKHTLKMIKKTLLKIDKKLFPEFHTSIHSEDDLEKTIRLELGDIPNVRILDVGCGETETSPLRMIAPRVKYIVGVDLFDPYLEKNREKKVYNEYIKMNAMDIDKHFEENSFDVVIATDLLEHLSKEDGKLFIEKAKKIAYKKLILFTPNGYINQDEYHGNEYQVHKSGWTTKELKTEGFNRIYGINGLKFLRGEQARIKFKPQKIWERISYISSKLTKRLPKVSFQLLAVMEK